MNNADTQQNAGAQTGCGDEQRRLPTLLMAGSGAGKRLFAGRTIGLYALLRGRRLVILNPSGESILTRLHEALQSQEEIP